MITYIPVVTFIHNIEVRRYLLCISTRTARFRFSLGGSSLLMWSIGRSLTVPGPRKEEENLHAEELGTIPNEESQDVWCYFLSAVYPGT